MVGKHRRIVGVTIHNRWGAAGLRKSLCRPHRPRIRILFMPDHKKVYDLPVLLHIKQRLNSLVSRLNSSISARMQGLIVQTGIDYTNIIALC